MPRGFYFHIGWANGETGHGLLVLKESWDAFTFDDDFNVLARIKAEILERSAELLHGTSIVLSSCWFLFRVSLTLVFRLLDLWAENNVG